jgi:hypothetical protein
MSDYLANLIARTVSPAVAVRPRLASLFEPAPATRATVSSPEFEREGFVEPPPVIGPSQKLAPMSLSIPTPRQSVLHEPAQTVPEVSPAKKNLKARQESESNPLPTSIPRQSTLQKPSRIFSHREDGEPSLEPKMAVQPRIFPWATQTPRQDERSNSSGRRSDVIKSPLRDLLQSSSDARERELPARSDIQAIVPTIRPLPPIAPLPPAAATLAPAINVTIGRVEIRAVPPITQQRAKPKTATVLSLEDYLRHRTKGVSR